MGIFIEVTVQAEAFTPDSARELAALCPVDIFALEDGVLKVRAENEDECTLCNLCLDAAPQGAVQIRKLYKDETLVSGR